MGPGPRAAGAVEGAPRRSGGAAEQGPGRADGADLRADWLRPRPADGDRAEGTRDLEQAGPDCGPEPVAACDHPAPPAAGGLRPAHQAQIPDPVENAASDILPFLLASRGAAGGL